MKKIIIFNKNLNKQYNNKFNMNNKKVIKQIHKLVLQSFQLDKIKVMIVNKYKIMIIMNKN